MISSPTPKAIALSEHLMRAVQAYPADALMLSGGIDSSLLAALDPAIPSYTVCLEGHALDIEHAAVVARHLSLNWTPITITAAEALDVLRTLVQLTRTFDLALLNDIPLYVGMSRAKDKGAKVIRTGDFADTLFAGYEYLWELDLHDYLTNLLPHLTLASDRLGSRMGLEMDYPYLDPEVVELALTFDRSDNIEIVTGSGPGDFHVQVRDTDKAQGYTWSKITLRRAADGLLPPEAAWRIKTDLEYGSGTYLLEPMLASLVSDEMTTELAQSGRRFWSRAHMGLFTLYQEAGLSPLEPTGPDYYACLWCNAGIIRGRYHCLTCGAYPADEAHQ